MKIAIASDHAGYKLKEELKSHLLNAGYEVNDCGTVSDSVKVDYPDWGFKAALEVAARKADRAVLICGTGVGMSIAANKVRGIRAALCHDHYTAVASRRHNDANVLVMGARVLGPDVAAEILKTWLNEPFEGERHSFRLDKISAFETQNLAEIEAAERGGRTVVMDHPLVKHKIGIMRNKETSSKDFRDLVQEVAGLMVYEVTRNLPLEEKEIETPVAKTRVFTLSGKKLAIVPVLRAGLGMVEGILKIVPNAKVGHIGLYRDPETLKPVDYYCKLPKDISERDIFVVDPMLATGGSAVAAVSHIKERGGKKVSLVCLIAAPQGIEAFHNAHPDVDIFVAAVDSHLNDHSYIVPGLGDAGDRLFGTK